MGDYALAAAELLTDGGEVHWLLDHLPVPGYSLDVDRVEEGPGIVVVF